MIPPTSIDGTDITGATIDGTHVQEITVDGDTVFSAQTLPVAYSNLVAWYPFDSATYGGSNADDVTAIIGGSGDDTAYDGTVTGATYQSSGGVTDINAGANSGAYDFHPAGDIIIFSGTENNINIYPISLTCWLKFDSFPGGNRPILGALDFDSGDPAVGFGLSSGSPQILAEIKDGNNTDSSRFNAGFSTSTYQHAAMTVSSSTARFYMNGSLVETFGNNRTQVTPSHEYAAGGGEGDPFDRSNDGRIDDVRIYNKVLSQSEINTIISRTQP